LLRSAPVERRGRSLESEAARALERLVTANAQSIEEGLTVIDAHPVLGQASMDLVAIDGSGTLTLIAVGFVADDAMLLRMLDAYAWCHASPGTLQRLYPGAALVGGVAPRVIFVAERLPLAFLRKTPHLRVPILDCLELRHADAGDDSVASLEPVQSLRSDAGGGMDVHEAALRDAPASVNGRHASDGAAGPALVTFGDIPPADVILARERSRRSRPAAAAEPLVTFGPFPEIRRAHGAGRRASTERPSEEHAAPAAAVADVAAAGTAAGRANGDGDTTAVAAPAPVEAGGLAVAASGLPGSAADDTRHAAPAAIDGLVEAAPDTVDRPVATDGSVEVDNPVALESPLEVEGAVAIEATGGDGSAEPVPPAGEPPAVPALPDPVASIQDTGEPLEPAALGSRPLLGRLVSAMFGAPRPLAPLAEPAPVLAAAHPDPEPVAPAMADPPEGLAAVADEEVPPAPVPVMAVRATVPVEAPPPAPPAAPTAVSPGATREPAPAEEENWQELLQKFGLTLPENAGLSGQWRSFLRDLARQDGARR
jgi:hypothetical protein